MPGKLLFGCVADDFTGGSDAASFLALGGMKVILCSCVPDRDFVLPDDCEGVVVALKSRTQASADAVADSLAAVAWLKERGAKRFYFKYCSTFDSTPQGNIGPVTDAILRETGVQETILCPALPANDRRVRNGILYVKGVPLAESPMRNHPLTPMTESRIAELMTPQGAYECVEVHLDELRGDVAAVRAKLAAFRTGREHFYIVTDCDNDADCERIAELFGTLPFLTGGSGILTALARKITGRREGKSTFSGVAGEAVIVAGSCSTATRAQELWYERQGGTTVRLNDAALLEGSETPEAVWAGIQRLNASAPLIYSYDTPEGLAHKRNAQGAALAGLIERTLSGVAALALKNGRTRIIAAGGETSGAVTQALGFKAFWIGDSIAPGVPVMIPVENPKVRLVLKSGNFGQEDFFGRALAATGKET